MSYLSLCPCAVYVYTRANICITSARVCGVASVYRVFHEYTTPWKSFLPLLGRKLYNRILFSFYWNCRTIFVARSFQFFNTGIFFYSVIIYSVDVAWRVKTFFEILGVFRNMSVEIWRGCPLYVAATSNLNVHISKLGGWKIYIYICYTGEALFRKRFNVLFSAYTIMQVIYYSISGQEKRKNWSISLSLISQFILNR